MGSTVSELLHLLWKAFHEMPYLISQNWTGIGMGVSGFVLYHVLFFLAKGWPAMKRLYRENIAFGIATAIFMWSSLFIYSVGATIYRDRLNVNKRWSLVVNEKNTLKQGLAERDEYIKRLEKRVKEREDYVSKPTTPTVAQLPPTSARLTVTYENKVNSKQGAKFETEITVSTTAPFPGSLALALICNNPIVELQMRSSRMLMSSSEGRDVERKRYFLTYGSATPPFDPSHPFVFDVWSNKPILCSAQTE
jgi:hypothetical protein